MSTCISATAIGVAVPSGIVTRSRARPSWWSGPPNPSGRNESIDDVRRMEPGRRRGVPDVGAAVTCRGRLGTAVVQLAARPPATLGMQAMTIDALAGGGRMIVGIGVSGPQIVEGWYGQPWGKPNARLRDYIAILRKVIAREGP